MVIQIILLALSIVFLILFFIFKFKADNFKLTLSDSGSLCSLIDKPEYTGKKCAVKFNQVPFIIYKDPIKDMFLISRNSDMINSAYTKVIDETLVPNYNSKPEKEAAISVSGTYEPKQYNLIKGGPVTLIGNNSRDSPIKATLMGTTTVLFVNPNPAYVEERLGLKFNENMGQYNKNLSTEYNIYYDDITSYIPYIPT